MIQTVTVNGKSSDPDGVSSVSVNGVAATVAADNSWSAQVTLSSGSNQVSVSVTDSNGGVTDDADTVTINYLEVPITFTLDPDATRVVGVSNTLTQTGVVQNLMEHNYDTGEQTIFDSVQVSGALTCFRRFEDEFIHIKQEFGGDRELYRYELASGQETLLASIPDTVVDGGAGYKVGSIRELVCGDVHTSAYALVNFVLETGQGYSKSRIVEIDLGTQTFSTLSETDPAAVTPWLAMHIALDDDQIVTMVGFNGPSPLVSVSLTDGMRTELTPGLNVTGFVLHPEIASGLVYAATFEGIDEIDLNAGTLQNISIVSNDDPFAFAQIRSIGFDAANSRVIVGDESLDTLIAIDTSTGVRSEFVSRGVGTGAPLVVPRNFVISADGLRAFVVDDGGNVAERLFEIDLATGDRRVIGDINQPFNYTSQGLAIDEDGRRAFVAFRHLVLEVNLDTETVNEVVNVDSTILDSIGSLLFDAGNNRLLIGDPSNDGIYALGLGSGLVELVSRAGENGSGDAFGTLVSITKSDTATEIFAAGQASGALYRVNLDTGDRQEFMTTCDLGEAPNFQSLMQIRYNAAANELLILGGDLYSVDLDTDECEVMPRNTLLLEVQPVSAEQLFAVTFGSLLQYDRETGEVVIVSK